MHEDLSFMYYKCHIPVVFVSEQGIIWVPDYSKGSLQHLNSEKGKVPSGASQTLTQSLLYIQCTQFSLKLQFATAPCPYSLLDQGNNKRMYIYLYLIRSYCMPEFSLYPLLKSRKCITVTPPHPQFMHFLIQLRIKHLKKWCLY